MVTVIRKKRNGLKDSDRKLMREGAMKEMGEQVVKQRAGKRNRRPSKPRCAFDPRGR